MPTSHKIFLLSLSSSLSALNEERNYLTWHTCWNSFSKPESMAKYGAKAQEKVEKAMHERKHGELKSGRSGKKVTSRKQAIAIGLSEARQAGAKVPKKKS